MAEILRVEELVKVYKTKKIRFLALRGVSLSINEGEFVAIVGTSGSGKSTLLHCMAGFERPTAGKIEVGNSSIHEMNEDELAEFRLENVGFVFQDFNLSDMLTTLENVGFPLMLKGVDKKSRDRQAKEMLEKVGLSGHIDHNPNELSGGQRQRVAIARALITRPKILFADEPTGNLDSEPAEEMVLALMELVKKEGMTLIMVTHDSTKAKYADRIIHMKDGEIDEKR